MKAKAITRTKMSKTQFFIHMIAPLLIGFMICMMSQAHASWNSNKDLPIAQSPLEQGWVEVKFQDENTLLRLDPAPTQLAFR